MTFSPRVMRLRYLQVRAVVVGVFGGIGWLMGLSLPQRGLAYLGAGTVLLAWISILVLGGWTLYVSRQEQRNL